ncbi:hypothetical protein, partial [Burkholderia gladioli]|uniref:hypothetical protein n=1 Tax=Burkholderia gladioli TaxID=28095 RepID=UPI0034DB0884
SGFFFFFFSPTSVRGARRASEKFSVPDVRNAQGARSTAAGPGSGAAAAGPDHRRLAWHTNCSICR